MNEANLIEIENDTLPVTSFGAYDVKDDGFSDAPVVLLMLSESHGGFPYSAETLSDCVLPPVEACEEIYIRVSETHFRRIK